MNRRRCVRTRMSGGVRGGAGDRSPYSIEEHSPLPEGARWGHVHFAFNVPRDRLSAAVEQVQSHGIAVYGPTHFDWMQAISYYFYDLDGNLLEFWSPE